MYVNQPGKNPKFGSIKLDNPAIYVSVPSDQLPLFQRGKVETIEYSTTSEGYHNLKRLIVDSGPPTPQAAPPKQNGGGWKSTPADPERTNTSKWQPKSQEEQLAIFVTGVVGRAMQSGKFEAQDILMLTTMAKDAYEAHFMSRNASSTAPIPMRRLTPERTSYDEPNDDPSF
jgi:hypothetical protein